MAVVTLPNGAKHNTSLDIYDQPTTDDYTGSIDFCEQVIQNNDMVQTFISGSNPNLPKRDKQRFTDTSYDTYNYTIETSFHYTSAETYAVRATQTKLIIESK